jgi:hypothetical protein
MPPRLAYLGQPALLAQIVAHTSAQWRRGGFSSGIRPVHVWSSKPCYFRSTMLLCVIAREYARESYAERADDLLLVVAR